MEAGIKRISTGYVPRRLQQELHGKLKRFNVLVMHRRFGKTVFGINEFIDQAYRNPRKLPPPRYAYIAPQRDQAKRVSWDYYKQYTAEFPNREVNEAELRIDIPTTAGSRGRFMVLGADNPASIKGIYLDYADLDEYGEMHPSVFTEVVRPMLSDFKGRCIFKGTPKGQNNFYKLYKYATESGDPEWFGAMYKASETGIIDQAELESARRTMSEEEYEQEYECSFSAGIVGAYFTKEMDRAQKDGRITAVPYEPRIPVDMYFDLGLSDTTAVWFVQSVGVSFRAINYLEDSDLSIPEWVKIIKETGYNLGEFILPHDAKARDLSTGKSREEAFRSLGCRTRIIPRNDKMDSINAARMMIPKVWFDKTKCLRGIEALQNYQRKWDKIQEVFSQKPLHSWASNGADAFQQLALGARDRPEDYERDKKHDNRAITDYDPFE